MIKYLKIYLTILKLNFAYFVTYRANFYNSLISSTIWGGFSIASIYLLTARTQMVAGWTRDEILLLATAYVIMIGVFHILFAKNFELFHETIDQAKLDSLLLKPVNTQFLLTMKNIKYAAILRLVLGGALLYYLLYHRLEYFPSGWQYAGFFLLMFFGVVVVYAIWFIVATLMIWNPRLSNLIELLYNTTSLARFPQDLFRELSFLLFFFVFPLTLVANAPVKILIGRDFIEDTLWLAIMAGALFYAAKRFWRYALRFYTSAST